MGQARTSRPVHGFAPSKIEKKTHWFSRYRKTWSGEQLEVRRLSHEQSGLGRLWGWILGPAEQPQHGRGPLRGGAALSGKSSRPRPAKGSAANSRVLRGPASEPLAGTAQSTVLDLIPTSLPLSGLQTRSLLALPAFCSLSFIQVLRGRVPLGL